MNIESSTRSLVATSAQGFVERHRARLEALESDPANAGGIFDEVQALGWLGALTDPEDPSSAQEEPQVLATIVREVGRVCAPLATRILAHHFCRTCILGAKSTLENQAPFTHSDWLGLEATVGDPRLGPSLRIVPSGSTIALRGSMRLIIGGDRARFWLGTTQAADGTVELVVVESEAAFQVSPVVTLGLHGLGGVDANFVDVSAGHFQVIAAGKLVAKAIARANEFISLAYLELTLSLLEQAQRIAVVHAQTRRQFGTVLDQIPAVAAMLGCIDRAIALTRMAAQKGGLHSELLQPLVAEVKSITLRATDAALQTLGGAGYIVGSGVERHWRDARQLGELFLRDPW